METTHLVRQFTRSITFKFILVGIISLLLLIPAAWVKNLIQEREQRGKEVFNEISSIWGFEQNITGPWLTVPYVTFANNGSETVAVVHKTHFLPKELNVDVVLKPEIRYRGIYKVVVYSASVKINGTFDPPEFPISEINPADIMWQKATLTMGITDMRGIRNSVTLDWNGTSPEIVPGTTDNDLASSGFYCGVPVSAGGTGPCIFSTILDLNGTKSFNVYPLGKQTRVTMKSDWPDPGFIGAFLPVERQVDNDGFNARWLITHLNRNFPQSWTGDRYNITASRFGVEMINPVDHYQQSYRSVKYAMMFIGLTFLLFILLEILNKKRLHPIQYVLTGIGLVIFYSLLVSLSERLGFSIAYLISSASVILLISYYIWASLGKLKFSLFTGAVLSALYIFLYVVLRMQDFALLLGSVGLFIVLAVFMILTRKINWYREEE